MDTASGLCVKNAPWGDSLIQRDALEARNNQWSLEVDLVIDIEFRRSLETSANIQFSVCGDINEWLCKMVLESILKVIVDIFKCSLRHWKISFLVYWGDSKKRMITTCLPCISILTCQVISLVMLRNVYGKPWVESFKKFIGILILFLVVKRQQTIVQQSNGETPIMQKYAIYRLSHPTLTKPIATLCNFNLRLVIR